MASCCRTRYFLCYIFWSLELLVDALRFDLLAKGKSHTAQRKQIIRIRSKSETDSDYLLWKGRLKSIFSALVLLTEINQPAFWPAAQAEFTSAEHLNHRRVEPPFGRRNPQKRTRLTSCPFLWCGHGDSNPNASLHENLNLACLPIPSCPQISFPHSACRSGELSTSAPGLWRHAFLKAKAGRFMAAPPARY